MDQITELWITCSKSGNKQLFFEEPYSVEGEWYCNSSESVIISADLINDNIDYASSPKKAFLKINNL